MSPIRESPLNLSQRQPALVIQAANTLSDEGAEFLISDHAVSGLGAVGPRP